MTFKDWVKKQGGVMTVAKILNVKWRTVYYWLEGRRIPSLIILEKIMKLAGKSLNYKSLINEFITLYTNKRTIK